MLMWRCLQIYSFYMWSKSISSYDDWIWRMQPNLSSSWNYRIKFSSVHTNKNWNPTWNIIGLSCSSQVIFIPSAYPAYFNSPKCTRTAPSYCIVQISTLGGTYKAKQVEEEEVHRKKYAALNFGVNTTSHQFLLRRRDRQRDTERQSEPDR